MLYWLFYGLPLALAGIVTAALFRWIFHGASVLSKSLIVSFLLAIFLTPTLHNDERHGLMVFPAILVFFSGFDFQNDGWKVLLKFGLAPIFVVWGLIFLFLWVRARKESGLQGVKESGGHGIWAIRTERRPCGKKPTEQHVRHLSM